MASFRASRLSTLKTVSMRLALTTALTLLIPMSSWAALPAPSPLSPAAYVTERSPDFIWSQIDSAVSYEFMLMDENESAVYFNQAGIAAPPFTIAGAVFDRSKAYHWKVRAFDAAGSASDWSETESFLIYDPDFIPETLTPSGYIGSVTPNFQWSAVDGAVNYDLWIMNEAETSTINVLGSLDATSYQEPSDMPFVPYTVYHYRVRARAADGTTGIWSDPNSFMMYSGQDTPKLVGPQAQAPLGQMNFSWQPVGGAVSYEFVLMNEAETASVINDKNVLVNGYAPAADAAVSIGPVYHWKVRANFPSGGHSLWSETFSFAFFNPARVPDALMPFGYVTTGRPLLEWSQVADAVRYKIQVLDSVTQQILLSDVVANDTRYDLGLHLKLKSNASYDWRVASVAADGSSSTWSAPRSFKITKDIWSGLVTGLKMSARFYPQQKISFAWQPLALDGLPGVRYHVVLRAQPDDGYRTLWSGDASLDNPGSLVLPADVLLLPHATHAWIVQAYAVDGTLIGESRKYNFKSPAAVPDQFQAQIVALQAVQDAETAQLKVDLAKLLADYKMAQADRVATLANNQAAQTANYQNSHATQTANLQKSQDTAVANLLKSQASALATLQKKKGVTPAAIDQLIADQAKAMATLRETQKVAVANLQTTQTTQLANVKAAQTLQMDAYLKTLAKQLDAYIAWEGRKAAYLETVHQWQMNRLLRQQESELLKTR